MSKKALIFDFDLTLADSSKGIFQCINYAVEKMGLDRYDYSSIKKLIGYSLTETFKILTGNDKNEDAEKFKAFFTEHADIVMNDNTFLFNEVYNVIPCLKKEGFLLGIVSTKYRYRIAGVLEREKLLNYFDCIIGGEDVKQHKPSAEGLLLAVKKLNLNNQDALYIGDTLIDAETAKTANIDFIGVLSGETREADFKEYHVTTVIQNLSYLYSLLRVNGYNKFI
jgi:phosphoglycolate phosphatase